MYSINKEKIDMANQKMRYNDLELDLLKRTFAEDDEMLMLIRKVMLQMPLDVLEIVKLDIFKSDDLYVLMRKIFLPELDAKTPIGQQIDLWMTVNFQEKTAKDSYNLFLAREKTINYIKQQLEYLKDTKKVGKIKFSGFEVIEGKTADELYIDMTARNTIIANTEAQLSVIRTLAGLKSETPEETKARLLKNSNQ